MERVTVLHKEASALRALAGRFEMQPLKDALLDLAARCDVLAKSMGESAAAVSELTVSNASTESRDQQSVRLGTPAEQEAASGVRDRVGAGSRVGGTLSLGA